MDKKEKFFVTTKDGSKAELVLKQDGEEVWVCVLADSGFTRILVSVNKDGVHREEDFSDTRFPLDKKGAIKQNKNKYNFN